MNSPAHRPRSWPQTGGGHPGSIRRAPDEYEERTVIERLRERVVCVEAEIFAGLFGRLKRQTVVDRVSAGVGEIEDPPGAFGQVWI